MKRIILDCNSSDREEMAAQIAMKLGGFAATLRRTSPARLNLEVGWRKTTVELHFAINDDVATAEDVVERLRAFVKLHDEIRARCA